ncbi:MAG TPA: SGNH/GDSL hydrolase family protein [Patescibacteria group bacterium]|nr:SGNH/GDSL hydrolase family protein [Patescibacteria group bacterium]
MNMHRVSKKGVMVAIIILAVMIAFVAFEFLWVKYNGTPVPEPTISRTPQVIGSGSSLSYVVLGDSTAVSQGGAYEQGYAVATAHYLAKSHQVTWVNLAVSGSRAADIATKQAVKAATYKPDMVLIAVGANDVTHLTSSASVRKDLINSIATIRKANSAVRIIMTGSPDMGSVPRFPQPLRWLAGKRTVALNMVIMQVATEQRVVFAPIAEKTGPIFRAHPDLFAADKFHPNTEGYLTWISVLTAAIDQQQQ